MKKYKANKRGYYTFLVIGIMALPVVIFLLDQSVFMENPFVVLLLILPGLPVLWIYFDTYYTIVGHTLHYKSAFIKGGIDINSIKQITKGKTMWSGIKPALARKGLTIVYRANEEIYIAPQSNDELIADLLKINKNIKVIE